MKLLTCANCGLQAVPFFGMYLPCHKDEYGVHRKMSLTEVADQIVARRLWSVYQGVMHTDKDMFDKYATVEEKVLLHQGREEAGE